MKISIPDQIRIFLGKKYLDWAETLPRFGGGIIASLQQIREYQRRSSEAAYERSRPPKGTEIEFLYFRLMEMFHVEEFDKLSEGLIQLFPGLASSFPPKDFSADFRRDAETISGGGWRRLGLVMRQSKTKMLFDSPREMPELPTEVDHISVALHKILASVFVVAMDVHLNPEATRYMVRLQDRHYLPTVRFRKLIPRGTGGGGHSEEPPEKTMRQEILSWFDQLRASVELCMRPYLEGYFMQQPNLYGARLPAVEVFALRGVPEDETTFGTWKEEARGWCHSFGFNLLPFDAYKSENVLYLWSQDKSFWGETAHRLLVFWEPYLKSKRTMNFADGDKGAFAFHTGYLLDALLPVIVILQYLGLTRRNLEKLRQVTFRNMNVSLFSRFRLGAYVKLNDVLQRQYMLLERLSLELEQQKKWILKDMDSEEVTGLKDIGFISNPNREHRNLRDVFFEAVEYTRDLLKNHLSLIKTSFSEYLIARNMHAMFRFQRSIFWLTIIVAIATIAGVAANWKSIREFIMGILD